MPLTYKTINEEVLPAVTGICLLAFPEDFKTKDSPQTAFLASLHPEDHQEFIESGLLKTLEYYTATDEAGTVVGVTGLYTRTVDEPTIVWLGWYAVHPLYRGKGYGREILEWTMNEARKRGFKIMRLYTSDLESEATAQIVYEKFGFKEIGREKSTETGTTTLYKEVTL